MQPTILTPKEKGLLRRQTRQAREEYRLGLLHFCFLEMRHLIMEHLELSEQIQFNKAFKVYYLDIGYTIEGHTNIFRFAHRVYKNHAMYFPFKGYNPLTKKIYQHEKSLFHIKELFNGDEGLICNYISARSSS